MLALVCEALRGLWGQRTTRCVHFLEPGLILGSRLDTQKQQSVQSTVHGKCCPWTGGPHSDSRQVAGGRSLWALLGVGVGLHSLPGLPPVDTTVSRYSAHCGLHRPTLVNFWSSFAPRAMLQSSLPGDGLVSLQGDH